MSSLDPATTAPLVRALDARARHQNVWGRRPALRLLRPAFRWANEAASTAMELLFLLCSRRSSPELDPLATSRGPCAEPHQRCQPRDPAPGRLRLGSSSGGSSGTARQPGAGLLAAGSSDQVLVLPHRSVRPGAAFD
jgi:hypothetical protein